MGTWALGPLRSVQREEADSSVEDRLGWVGARASASSCWERGVWEAQRPEKLRRCKGSGQPVVRAPAGERGGHGHDP